METGVPSALIADADGFFRLALSAILKRELGFNTIYEAASVDEATLILRAQPNVALALFDQSMTGMRQDWGLSAVRKYAADAKVVVVSGSVERTDILRALSMGVHGYIPKIAGPAELARALNIVLSGDIYVPSRLAIPPSNGVDHDANPPHGAARLTARQREVLDALASGLSNKEIARRFGLGEGTVKIHVAALLKALQLPNRSAAAVYAATMRRSA